MNIYRLHVAIDDAPRHNKARHMDVPGDTPMDTLHKYLKEIFKEDIDADDPTHLYSFVGKVKGHQGGVWRIEGDRKLAMEFRPYGANWAPDVTIGSLGLGRKDGFTWYYDAGSTIAVEILVLEIADPDPEAAYPRVTAPSGIAAMLTQRLQTVAAKER